MRLLAFVVTAATWAATCAAACAAVCAAACASACTEPRSPECKQACKREAECIDSTGSKLPFDEKECIAACAALQNDVQHSAARVLRHIECVKKQTSCVAVLECK